MRHHSARLVAALALAGAAATLLAQSNPPQDQQQQQPPRFRVEANFVRVDAYPLKDGKPVMGLTADDFEIREDGALQKIETFEHVLVRAAGPQTERVEPNNQREALQAVSNPRNRVFVIFLDRPFVSVESAHRMNEPLIRLIDRILGPDDLVGVMTPEMAASQVVFGRKTVVIEESLRKNWPWGERFTLHRDDTEEAYKACYPPMPGEDAEHNIVKKMIARKRERATLEALEDLVRYLRALREERKAILTVTEGWVLYREDPQLTTLRKNPNTGGYEPIPGVDPITVGPNGKLTTKDTREISTGNLSKSQCDSDRMRLAMLDNHKFFLDILDEANYGNASFYPIDPRGLPVFDNPIGPDPPPPITVDAAMLRQRIEVMRTLAENTDGMAVVNNNDLDKGLRRIADDLTSYYLMGYYSTNAKLDGRFRSLKVRVKQPGVEVRARRGYRAATAEEVTAARKAADAPVPEATAAVTTAISKLDRLRADARFRINAARAGDGKRTIWIAGEVQGTGGRPDDLAQCGTVDIEVAAGSTSATTRVVLRPGERTFLTSLAAPAETGELAVRARLTAAEGSSIPLADSIRLADNARAAETLLYRRGVSTGNRLLPTADFRFSRTERVRVDIPVGADVKPGTGRVLDRAGQPLQVPITVSERADESSGQRWIAADVSLAPLSNGDYAVEVQLTGPAEVRVLTPIRVVR